MKVTYIGHSGFLLETAEADFLFDYYNGTIPERTDDKPLVVFVSHRHHDHYNPEIFELLKKYPDTRYILSKDVPVKKEINRYKEQKIDLEKFITVVVKNSVYMLELSNGKRLRIETFQSTDEGVAFYLEFGDRKIYHAGDLNLWLWEGESGQYNENMRKSYFRELEKLKGRKIDAAFIPLDPRQEKHAFGGIESFIAYTETEKIFPMHFWEQYEIIDAFLNCHPEYEKQVQRIGYAGQNFEIKDRED